MQKELKPLLITTILTLILFTFLIIAKGNYEFLFYLVVVIILMWIVFHSYKKVKYPHYVLWNLLTWAILHLAGGNIDYKGTRLYDWIIVPLVGEPYSILKYDQVVHVYGFFVATLVVYYVLAPLLKKNIKATFALGLVIVMAGLGLGAMNEIVEFTATIIAPGNGVGSYINNAIDLVTDFIGALIAYYYIKKREF